MRQDYRRLKDLGLAIAALFEESAHPRDGSGRFSISGADGQPRYPGLVKETKWLGNEALTRKGAQSLTNKSKDETIEVGGQRDQFFQAMGHQPQAMAQANDSIMGRGWLAESTGPVQTILTRAVGDHIIGDKPTGDKPAVVEGLYYHHITEKIIGSWVQAEYLHTQMAMHNEDIKSVVLERGFSPKQSKYGSMEYGKEIAEAMIKAKAAGEDSVHIPQRMLSSWTEPDINKYDWEQSKAYDFANKSENRLAVVIRAEVPTEQIFSNFRTNPAIDHMGEREHVVIAPNGLNVKLKDIRLMEGTTYLKPASPEQFLSMVNEVVMTPEYKTYAALSRAWMGKSQEEKEAVVEVKKGTKK